MLCDHGVEIHDSTWICGVRVSVLQYLVMRSYKETCVEEMISLFVSQGATIAEIPKRISRFSRIFAQQTPRVIMACAEGGYMYHAICCYSYNKFRVLWRDTIRNPVGNNPYYFVEWKQTCALLAMGGSVYEKCVHMDRSFKCLETQLLQLACQRSQ